MDFLRSQAKLLFFEPWTLNNFGRSIGSQRVGIAIVLIFFVVGGALTLYE
ncbi:hypothetical protein IIC38_08005 [candidate division KSB1 bacterium]|nr:hypothetical protein [candidate division KSB1 bacterium]